MTEKTQEQRIADGVEALSKIHGYSEDYLKDCVKAVLEAADAPVKPKWPTDESVLVYRTRMRLPPGEPGNNCFEMTREGLKEALLEDPIIQAAIAYRDAFVTSQPSFEPARKLRACLDKTGL